MDTVREFVQRTHAKGNAKQATRHVGLKAAQDIAQTVDWDVMADWASVAREYVPQVLAEIDELRAAHAAHPERMTLRAFMFGITTPHRDERQSIAWALGNEAYWDVLAPLALAKHSYTSLVTGKRAKLGFYNALASTLFAVSMRGLDTAVDALEALPGVGPKVARMIHAVCHPDARVFTVDIWHTRQLLHAAGRDYSVEANPANTSAYAVLEKIWLDYAERFFPEVPTWAVQWATWCAAEGKFVSHRALWADLAS
jgi:hypothetical protein